MPPTLQIEAMGSFFVGGRTVVVEGEPLRAIEMSRDVPAYTFDPNGTYAIDHAHVSYVIPVGASRVPVVFAHGGGMTGACWETTPDGRPGVERSAGAGWWGKGRGADWRPASPAPCPARSSQRYFSSRTASPPGPSARSYSSWATTSSAARSRHSWRRSGRTTARRDHRWMSWTCQASANAATATR